MIKRILLTIVVLVAGVVMLAVSVWQVRADDEVKNEQMIQIEQVSPIEQEVTYYLPYPGILPDHPLYWMKMLRDRIEELLATKSLQKIELWRMNADKRLGAAKVLIEGNKVDLGKQTALKSVGYMNRVVAQLEQLKREGINVGDQANLVERESLKHAQVLKALGLNELSDEMVKLHDRVLVVLERV